jgi:hypothetical protein
VVLTERRLARATQWQRTTGEGESGVVTGLCRESQMFVFSLDDPGGAEGMGWPLGGEEGAA